MSFKEPSDNDDGELSSTVATPEEEEEEKPVKKSKKKTEEEEIFRSEMKANTGKYRANKFF